MTPPGFEQLVAANGAFDADAAATTLLTHAVAGLHHLDPSGMSLTRWLVVGGAPVLVQVTLQATGVLVRTASTDNGVNEAVVELTRHWFDLETDLAPINAHLGADPVFTEHVRARPGLRATRVPVGFEAVQLAVLGQQVSLAAGRLFGARLVAAYGSSTDHPHLQRFPTATVVAAQPLDALRASIGLTRSRARTVHEVAALFADLGDDQVLPDRPVLAGVHGIGPWTLDYLAIRADRDPDAFPVNDAVLRRVLSSRGLDDAPTAAVAWQPHRSYAALRLWSMAV
ncbi:DNA-3-methyladenine glycosylase family protein [Propionibacteriaceae bacterium G1746]|uniref:DNA-3-methyladenine glycosylase family protein n=1 Tax=Aestuariimicrobium sp. G57 TaxID=3418485 RepID=UPI003C16435D